MPISHGNNKPYEMELQEELERRFYGSGFVSKNSSKVGDWKWMTEFLKSSMFGNVDIDTDSFFSEDDLWSESIPNKKRHTKEVNW